MKLWEYMDVSILRTNPAMTIEALDAAGRDGWETTGIVEENSTYRIYIMKRPLGEDPKIRTATEAVKHDHSVRYRCSGRCPYLGTEHEIVKHTYP